MGVGSLCPWQKRRGPAKLCFCTSPTAALEDLRAVGLFHEAIPAAAAAVLSQAPFFPSLNLSFCLPSKENLSLAHLYLPIHVSGVARKLGVPLLQGHMGCFVGNREG